MKRKRLVAALSSFLVPGLGQLIAGRPGRAVLMASVYYGLLLVQTLLAPAWMAVTFRSYVTGIFALWLLLPVIVAMDAWRCGNTRGSYSPSVFALFLVAFVGGSRLTLMYAHSHHLIPLQSFIAGDAMLPGIRPGEMVIGDTRPEKPARGNLTVVTTPLNTTAMARVMGLPGDLVKVDRGVLIRNAAPVQEDYLKEPMSGNMVDTVINPGYLFVLSDNRNASNDSRQYGTVPVGSVQARPLFILWSSDFTRIGTVLR